MTPLRRSARLVVAALAVSTIAVAGCSSSDQEEDLFNDGDPNTPVDVGTVVPPVDQGVGGGAPVDNVNEDFNEGGIGNPESDPDTDQPSQEDL